MKIPDFIHVLSTIKLLFPGEVFPANSDENRLVVWAELTALLKLQLNGKAISGGLKKRLNGELPQLLKIISKLNRNPELADLLEELNQEIETFYEGLYCVSDIRSDTELEANWQRTHSVKTNIAIRPDTDTDSVESSVKIGLAGVDAETTPNLDLIYGKETTSASVEDHRAMLEEFSGDDDF